MALISLPGCFGEPLGDVILFQDNIVTSLENEYINRKAL